MKTVALALLCATLLSAQKKPRDAPAAPETWPTSRTFAVSCDTVWPVALQSFISNGWGIKTSDRVGGVLTLEWTRGEYHGTKSSINVLIRQYTIEKSTGFYTIWNGFRIVSAAVIAAPAESGCSYSIATVYHGQGGGFGAGDAWRIVRSNGFFENKMLGEIEEKLKK